MAGLSLALRSPGLDTLARRLEHADGAVPLHQAERAWTQEELERLRRATPQRPGSGPHAREGWHAESSAGGITITNEVAHALYLVTGTRPHRIAAPSGGVLRWLIEGTPTYAKAVQHPGTAPVRALVEVLDKAPEDAAKALEQATDAYARHLAGGGD